MELVEEEMKVDEKFSHLFYFWLIAVYSNNSNNVFGDYSIAINEMNNDNA